MGHLKRIILAAIAALALTGLLGVSTASATTLEVTGVTQNGPVNIALSIKAGNTSVTRDTFGFFANTCDESDLEGETEKNFSTVVTGDGTKHDPTGKVAVFAFTKCDHTVTVHNPGKFYIEWTSGTNGRFYSEEADITEYSTLHGTHVTCTTGLGTPLGTITGVKHGEATLDINATLTCGPHLHSMRWTGTYTVTSPSGLGVSP